MIVGVEICDDGTQDDQGCNADCSGDHPDWICTGTLSSVCEPKCGDLKIYRSYECEDGNF